MSVINDLTNRTETFWLNPALEPVEPHFEQGKYSFLYVKAAQNRFMRFLPYIASAFPETQPKKGVIESPFLEISEMKRYLTDKGANIKGKLYLKDDARLPIAGSVKARGGIHEVLKIAEGLMQKAKLMMPTGNYAELDSAEFRDFFGQYTIQVGSTGNLGISIGRVGAKLGFNVIVHMSADAKEWKKELLRSEGVTVKEYSGNYSEAVANGRREAEADPNSFFVDDENSEDLFFGYSTAAMRLSVQLRKAGIVVDYQHPLFVYIPCGVGGAPSGIAWGLKQMYGGDVHCFFAEPVDSPCFTLSMASGKMSDISVEDIGLSGKTIADGLAVGRSSGFSCRMMEHLLSGAFTVTDEHMLEYQREMLERENLVLEPSACAGFRALEELGKVESSTCEDLGALEDVEKVESSACADLRALEDIEALGGAGSALDKYIDDNNLDFCMDQATHIVWATGGGLLEKYGME